MIIDKKVFFILSLSLLAILNIISATASCNANIKSVDIYSGSQYMGNYEIGDKIYIKPNLGENPLKVEANIEDTEDGCYSGNDNFKFKLFSSANPISADSFSTADVEGIYITTAIFTYPYDVTMPESFTSTITATPNGSSGKTVSIPFGFDAKGPSITTFKPNPKEGIYKPGTNITIDVTATDMESGLESIIISGGETYTFDGRQNSYTFKINDTITSDKIYTVTAFDKMGNFVSKSVKYIVDSDSPNIFDLKKTYSYDGTRKITFEVKVSDESFGLDSAPTPEVMGDFSKINPVYSKQKGKCTKLENETFSCLFSNLVIQLNQTQNININIWTEDILGNQANENFTTEIFIDTAPPDILDFYLLNDLGIRNIFSSSDDNVTLHLRFDDSSTVKKIILDTDKIKFINYDTEKSDIDNNYYVWSFGNLVKVYEEYDRLNITFSVTLIDEFDNKNKQDLKLTLDNLLPHIISIDLIETESIKDGIVSSGEKINFRMLVEDNNLGSDGENFIFGNFSEIDFRDGMDYMKADCSMYNTTVMQCDFEGIIVENGYIKRNVTFYASDNAANTKIGTYEVEVLKRSNETFSSYKINDLRILNPINRNRILSSSVKAWFEGNIEKASSDNTTIVNYILKSCDESGLNPLIITEFGLYPDNIVIAEQTDNYKEIALFADLKDHNNINDLNEKKIICTLAILKRDSTKIYPEELVDFNLVFEFYDVPQGSLLKAHATKINSKIEDIEWMGEWFDTTYAVYNFFNNICNVVYSGSSIISTISEAWTMVSYILHGFTFTKSIAMLNDKVVYGGQSFMSNLVACEGEGGSIGCFIKRTCDWVSCNNGGALLGMLEFGGGNLFEGGEEIPGLDMLVDVHQTMAGAVCSPFAGENPLDMGTIYGAGAEPVKKE